jgi:dTDP-4-dehydrorhamnose reductase
MGTYFSREKEGLVRFNLLSDGFSLFDKCTHVVILAAMANIDQCFLKKEEAYKFNVEKTIEFIQHLKKRKIKPIFISSDQVFRGTKGNYNEEDAPDPVNYYGEHKLRVEEFLKNNLGSYLILRISKTYSRDVQENSMFAEIFLKLKNKEKIKAAGNQIFNPTDVKMLCNGIYFCIRKNLDSVYHLADRNIMSRYDFAQSVAEEFGFDKNLIEKIDFNSLHFLEKRALNSSLNVEKFMNTFESSQEIL